MRERGRRPDRKRVRRVHIADRGCHIDRPSPSFFFGLIRGELAPSITSWCGGRRPRVRVRTATHHVSISFATQLLTLTRSNRPTRCYPSVHPAAQPSFLSMDQIHAGRLVGWSGRADQRGRPAHHGGSREQKTLAKTRLLSRMHISPGMERGLHVVEPDWGKTEGGLLEWWKEERLENNWFRRRSVLFFFFFFCQFDISKAKQLAIRCSGVTYILT
ncbi:hypothetical protein QBC43DRAFT_82213 [Cladorrhinum sp. PSN259]|nr:hypothetical protein QBC43DRAFT_82213 [Cladorrhinum sp. PSN259]